MTTEQKLEAVINWYRQQLADAQLQIASNNATVQELNEKLNEVSQELEELRVLAEEKDRTTGEPGLDPAK
jgi:flagellar biosynthesis chaperone FliJ